MKTLSSFKIGTRLGLSFASLLVLMAVTTAVGVYELRRIGTLSAERDVAVAHAADFEHWQSHVQLNLARALSVAASGFQAGAAAVIEPQMKSTSEQISKLQKALEATADDPAEKAAFEDVASKRKTYVDLRKKAAEMFKGGNAAEGDQLVAGPMTAAAKAYLDAIEGLQQRAATHATEHAAGVAAAISEGVYV
ncbi:hypothetical protein CLD22_29590, partial [Rubrivivax gelatinosus]|nr:hypothetical protein [Rubrivivax gelatinosus]